MKENTKISFFKNIFGEDFDCFGIWGTYLLVFFFKCEFLLLDNLELVTEVEFGGLLLKLGEFVFVFGYLLQGRLNALNK